MRIIFTILLMLPNFTWANEQCIFELLANANKYEMSVRRSSNVASLRTVETNGLIANFFIKSYSKLLNLENLVIVDDVLRDLVSGYSQSQRCNGKCQRFHLKGVHFIEYYEFGGVTVSFLVDSKDYVHVFEMPYDNNDLSFYDYFFRYECLGGVQNDELYKELIQIISSPVQ